MANVFKRIFNEGITSYPYKAHKNYEVTDVNYSSSFEISILRGVSNNGVLTEISTSKHQGVTYDTNLITGSGAISTELNKIPQQVVWSSLNSIYFKNTSRTLHPTASIVSIPQNKFGNGIKPNSVTVTDNSHDYATLTLTESKVTEEYGVLYDDDIDHTTFVDDKYSKLYLGFQNGTYGKYWKYNTDDSPQQNIVYAKNLEVVSGIDTTGEITSSGFAVTSQVSSSLYSEYNETRFGFLNQGADFSLSFWVNLPTSQSYLDTTSNNLIQQRHQKVNPYLYSDDKKYIDVSQSDPSYPFSIRVFNQSAGADSGKLVFDFNDGPSDKIKTIKSSTTINDNSWHHVVLNHTTTNTTGSYELFLDGTSVGTQVTDRPFSNNSDITIMCNNSVNYTGTSGSIDEVRIYNTTLSSDNIDSLNNNHIFSGSAYQTRDVGYVFYRTGLIVVSDPRPKYQNCFLGDGDWDYTNRDFEFKYKSTKDIEQNSYLCEIGRNEFNVSANNTLRKSGDETNNQLKDFVTGSNFRPYITQVGLYNDTGDLLAIAKLGSPLKKRQDVDVTIDVRLDFE